jgi:hypothetical protein
MLFPESLLAPETPVCNTVQLKVVPKIEPDNKIPVACNEQIVSVDGEAVTDGVGII